MNAIPHTNAERAGRWLASLWRAFARQEERTIRWLTSKGLPVSVARLLLLIVKLVVFGLLLYAAFWLALLVVLVVTATWLAEEASLRGGVDWAVGEQTDHKESVFYDPINYNDAPDPRFDDE
jgi:hypothetical protein